jgi:hypothetical protein
MGLQVLENRQTCFERVKVGDNWRRVDPRHPVSERGT